MKRKLKAIAAVLLVLVMLGSAMPMQLAAEAMTPPTTRYATPDGYNDHDYQKMVAFFEQTDENGVRNGEKLSENYDPTDPGTWREYDGDYCRGDITWTTVAGEYRLCDIFFGGIGNYALPLELVGFLDVSGCTALTEVRCWSSGDIQLTGLDVSGCTALEELHCVRLSYADYYSYNGIVELNVSNCTALTDIYCSGNQLTELDISANTELERLAPRVLAQRHAVVHFALEGENKVPPEVLHGQGHGKAPVAADGNGLQALCVLEGFQNSSACVVLVGEKVALDLHRKLVLCRSVLRASAGRDSSSRPGRRSPL